MRARRFPVVMTVLLSLPVFFLFQNFTASNLNSANVNPQSNSNAVQEAFRIYWHVGSHLEEISERISSPNQVQSVSQLVNSTDGYYFLLLQNGLLAYWPNRPFGCDLNFQHFLDKSLDDYFPKITFSQPAFGNFGVEALKASCQKSLFEYQKSLSNKPSNLTVPAGNLLQSKVHLEQLRKLVHFINTNDPKIAQKKVMGEYLIRNGDFNNNANSVQFKALPDVLQFLINPENNTDPKNILKISTMMIYQEPHQQIPAGSMYYFPQQVTGVDKNNENWMKENLNFSIASLSEGLGNFLKSLNFDNSFLPQLTIDIRRWGPQDVENIKKSPAQLDGVLFEGGTKALNPFGQNQLSSNLQTFAEGAAWLLANDKEVYFLMPASVKGVKNAIPSDTYFYEIREQDDLITEKTREYVYSLNNILNQKMNTLPGQNSVCNSRLQMIPASYSYPVHQATFPERRINVDGSYRIAGTISGQILNLNYIRDLLCKQPRNQIIENKNLLSEFDYDYIPSADSSSTAKVKFYLYKNNDFIKNAVAINKCSIIVGNKKKTFISNLPDCEGRSFEKIIGYALKNKTAFATRAAYRCSNPSGQYLDIVSDADQRAPCAGGIAGPLLFYIE